MYDFIRRIYINSDNYYSLQKIRILATSFKQEQKSDKEGKEKSVKNVTNKRIISYIFSFKSILVIKEQCNE